MKNLFTKGTLLLMALALFFNQSAKASSVTATTATLVSSAANFDESEIYNSFSEVNDIVSYISTNEDATYSDLVATNLSTSNLSSSAAIATNGLAGAKDLPFMSAFWWGCIFGPVGIVVVAVTTDSDKEQIKKAAMGCIIPVGCSTISTILYYAIFAVAANSTY